MGRNLCPSLLMRSGQETLVRKDDPVLFHSLPRMCILQKQICPVPSTVTSGYCKCLLKHPGRDFF